MTIETKAQISPAIIEALAIGALPDVQWKSHDDLCDCVYQRIGMWTNPYLAETLEVRLCCIWAELYRQYPEHVRLIPGFWDYNGEQWVTEPQEWNGEAEMPKALWYRQLARKQGRPVSDVRAEYASLDHLRPKGMAPREQHPFFLPYNGNWLAVDMGSWVTG